MARAPKLCSQPVQPKCLKKAVRQGRCELHQKVPFAGAKERWNALRPPGYNALRNRVAREAQGICEMTGCNNRGSSVDHIIAVVDGGTWTRDNLWLLCKDCHNQKRDGKQRRR
jgi:5-methylcytosine-specific restriction endonuclease McrA